MSFTRETLVAVLLFAVVFQFRLPDSPHALLDYDEGLNLGKAFMLAKGYALYSQIWSDQPPLYTYLLQVWTDCFGYSLEAARRLTAVFSGILLGSLYGLVRRRESRPAALAACGLLVVSSYFLRASGAVMIGLPALALFYLSLLLLSGDTPSPAATLASATAFGCALLTKLFVLLYLPLLPGLLYLKKEGRVSRIMIWSFSLVLTVSLMTFLPGPSFWEHAQQQLWGPHRLAQSRLPTASGLNFLRFDMSICLLSLLSTVVFIKRLKLPVTIYLLGLSALALHRPSWWHHYLLASIPMCWIAGVGIGRSVSLLRTWIRSRRGSWTLTPCFLIVCLGLYLVISLPMRIEKLAVQNQRRVGQVSSQVLDEMERLKPFTRWVATDQPLVAVLLDLPLPPEQVVLSTKRFKTGYSAAQFFDSALEYKPEQILLSRYRKLRRLAPARLEQDYEMVVETDRLLLYQRRDVLQTKGPKTK